MEVMKLRHAAALTMVGSYPMVAADGQEQSIRPDGAARMSWTMTALIGRDDPAKVHTRRCDQAGIEVALDAL
jgi:hypothetical protein